MQRVAFVTYREAPHLTVDDALSVGPLAALGIRVEALPWDDDSADWSPYDAVVVRSCWNYYLRPTRFAAWLDRLMADGILLANPPVLLNWNASKLYLLDLQARGAPVIASVHVPRGADTTLVEVCAQTGWAELVVKPLVSADGHATRRLRAPVSDRDARAFARLVRERDVLVQRLLPEVARDGEWSFVFFAGAFSHAALKRPGAEDFRVQARYGGTVQPVAAPDALVEQAAALLAQAPAPAVYARVDGCVIGDQLVLMELELLEPLLYLACHPGAPGRFAMAIRRYLDSPTNTAAPS